MLFEFGLQVICKFQYWQNWFWLMRWNTQLTCNLMKSVAILWSLFNHCQETYRVLTLIHIFCEEIEDQTIMEIFPRMCRESKSIKFVRDLEFYQEYELLKVLEFWALYGTLRSFCNKYNPEKIILNNLDFLIHHLL